MLWGGRVSVALTPIERNVVLLSGRGLSPATVAAQVGSSLKARDVEAILARLRIRDPEQVLAELVMKARHHHGYVQKAGQAIVQHAIDAGEALLEAKQRVPTGEWLDWLRTHFTDWSIYTARNYMRVARHRELLDERNPESLRQALAYLSDLAADDTRIDPAKRERVLALKAEGKTVAQISTAVGVAAGTVSNWVNPKTPKAHSRRGGGQVYLMRTEAQRIYELAMAAGDTAIAGKVKPIGWPS